MAIFNQVVKGGGGSTPDNYIELYIENGQLKKGSAKSLDFSGVTTATETFSYLFKNDTEISGSVILKDLTDSGQSLFRDAFYGTNVTYADLSGMTIVRSNGLYNTFYRAKLTGFDLSNLTTISTNYAMYNTFASIPTLVGVFSFPKLESCGSMQQTFASCVNITFFGMPKLKTIGTTSSSSGFQSVFNGCTSLAGVNLNAVEQIAGNYQQMQNAFVNTVIQVFRFPMLTSVTKGFGTSTVFPTVTTELHFRTDAQATIESAAGYSTKWGATNATVYFDLVGTLTGADGNTYTRDEYNSVYSDQHGQFQTAVAWTYNDTIYYTPAGTEPAVSDAIYSDAACTQSVTTITAVA